MTTDTTNKEAGALKPCPMCNASLSEATASGYHHHPSNSCIFSGFELSRDDAAAWNRRAPAEVQAEAVQWEAHLAEVVEHTIDTLTRQLDLIAERAPGAFLDKAPVVRSLAAHKQRLERALAERNESFAAPAAPAQSGEPIYQTGWPTPETVWGDVDQGTYETYSEFGYTRRRIVYAAPQPSQTAVVLDDERAARAIRLLEIAEPILEAAALNKAVTIAAGDLLRQLRNFLAAFPQPVAQPVAQPVVQTEQSDDARRYQLCRESAIERGLFQTGEEYDAMVDSSLLKNGKEPLTGRGHNYGKKVAKDGSLYRPQLMEQTPAVTLLGDGATTLWRVANAPQAGRGLAFHRPFVLQRQEIGVTVCYCPDGRLKRWKSETEAQRVCNRLNTAIAAVAQPVEQTRAQMDAQVTCIHPVVCPHAFLDDDGRWNCAQCMTAARPASGETE